MAISQHRPAYPACFLLLQLAALFISGSLAQSGGRYVEYIKVPFFSSPSLICDHPQLNITDLPNVRAISWVLPDGTNVNSESDVDPRMYSFSPAASPADPNIYAMYNLTALDISEEQFGNYLCVVEYTAGTPVSVIRIGLNVNGADFTDLVEEFKQNAIVGGVAAAIMLVVVGGGCLFWNYKYGGLDTEDDEDDLNGETEKQSQRDVAPNTTKLPVNGEKQFDNAAYKGDEEAAAVIDVHM